MATALVLSLGNRNFGCGFYKFVNYNFLNRAKWTTLFEEREKPIYKYSVFRTRTSMTSVVNYVKFHNGKKFPIIGLGTWQGVTKDTEVAVDTALEVGYRHIDTAFAYKNEDAVGRVLKKWLDSGKIKREDVFITTKLPPQGNVPEEVEKYLKKSLEALQLDYIDLYLVHQPVGMKETVPGKPIQLDKSTDLIALWKAMEKEVDDGHAKAIGISNFKQEQVERVAKSARIIPANLQVELHAYFQQPELRAACKRLGITVTSYSTLGSPGRAEYMKTIGYPTPKIPDLMDNPTVLAIAKKHNKSPAHVLLRHMIQHEVVVIPKSVKPERIRQNFQVFDFELTPEDMKSLNGLDQGEGGRTFVGFPGTEDHPEYPFPKK